MNWRKQAKELVRGRAEGRLIIPETLKFLDGKYLYRFFSKSEHAYDMCFGKVWFSTLEACRAHEGPRGDPGEAKHMYSVSHVSSDMPHWQYANKQLGYGLENTENSLIEFCNVEHVIPDAFVLCLTDRYAPDFFVPIFGEHCVRITDPVLFFMLTTNRVHEVLADFRGSEAGRVIYKDRTHADGEQEPGEIGFVKPKYPFEPEQEIRFLFHTREYRKLEGFSIHEPRLSGLCHMIPTP